MIGRIRIGIWSSLALLCLRWCWPWLEVDMKGWPTQVMILSPSPVNTHKCTRVRHIPTCKRMTCSTLWMQINKQPYKQPLTCCFRVMISTPPQQASIQWPGCTLIGHQFWWSMMRNMCWPCLSWFGEGLGGYTMALVMSPEATSFFLRRLCSSFNWLVCCKWVPST